VWWTLELGGKGNTTRARYDKGAQFLRSRCVRHASAAVKSVVKRVWARPNSARSMLWRME